MDDLIIHSYWVSENGSFVPLDKNGSPEDSCWCHNCGKWLTASDEYDVSGYYCPHCGAKMDGTPIRSLRKE